MFRLGKKKAKTDASTTTSQQVEEDEGGRPPLSATVGPAVVASSAKDGKKDKRDKISKRKSEGDVSRRRRSETAPGPQRNATMASLPTPEAVVKAAAVVVEDKDEDEHEAEFSFGSDSDSDDERTPKLNIVIKSKDEAAKADDADDADALRLDEPALAGLISPRSRSTTSTVRPRGRAGTITSPPPVLTATTTSMFDEAAATADPHMTEASGLMEQVVQLFDTCLTAADYPRALQLTESCLRALAHVSPLPRRHLRFAVVYRTAVRLLQAIDARLADAAATPELARLLRLLADLPLLPHHRVVALRLAITLHLRSENYGVAAQLIRIAIVRVPAADFQHDLAVCQQHNEANQPDPLMPPEYFDFTTRLRFCCATFAVIDTARQSATQCPACSAIYTEDACPPGFHCTQCFTHSIVE